MNRNYYVRTLIQNQELILDVAEDNHYFVSAQNIQTIILIFPFIYSFKF